MIKKILKIFFAMIFLIMGKIFIKKNRAPNKLMDNLSDKLHSIFIYTSFFTLYILWFNLEINTIDINSYIYIFMFLQLVIITRYFNPKMLIKKELQINIIKKINKFSLIVFILNWIFLSFGFASLFIIIQLLNNILYQFIINQIEKQKEQEEFKKQFGEGNFSKEDIVKKHILNLFESDIEINQLTKNDIKKQYRIMAKRYHPDVYKGEDQEKFVSINSSYKFLLDLIK
ncbi:MAG: DnaJ domain-containing protein [Campylobacterota bacterium]|nr:DnaJ domain-containing protein [Campylobacterota bacterium]